MFQIKNTDSITASIINNTKAMTDELTDFNVGSKNRTIIEATAREIDQFYQALLKGFYEAVPVSIYKSFAFGREAASAAGGYATFTKADEALSTVIVIPAGTSLKIPDTEYYYALPSDLTINAGTASKAGFIVATAVGSAWNAAADTITELPSPITGIASVTNALAFTNGADVESDYERKIRFQQYVKSLSRATQESLVYGAKTCQLLDANGVPVERVTDAIVHELYLDDGGTPGYADIYIWNGATAVTEDLIERTLTVLNGYYDAAGNRIAGWKGAGVVIDVKAVTADLVDVTAVVTCLAGVEFSTVEPLIRAAIDAYFNSFKIADVLIVAKLVDVIMSISGVYDVAISAPAANVTPAWNHINIRGTVTLSEG